jgi:hypothetical protein
LLPGDWEFHYDCSNSNAVATLILFDDLSFLDSFGYTGTWEITNISVTIKYPQIGYEGNFGSTYTEISGDVPSCWNAEKVIPPTLTPTVTDTLTATLTPSRTPKP